MTIAFYHGRKTTTQQLHIVVKLSKVLESQQFEYIKAYWKQNKCIRLCIYVIWMPSFHFVMSEGNLSVSRHQMESNNLRSERSGGQKNILSCLEKLYIIYSATVANIIQTDEATKFHLRFLLICLVRLFYGVSSVTTPNPAQ